MGIENDANRKNSIFYICTTCQSHYEQPLGKMLTKVHEGSGQANIIFKNQAATIGSDKCPECDSHLHVCPGNLDCSPTNFTDYFKIAGPMWSASLHDVDFVGKMLTHIEENKGLY